MKTLRDELRRLIERPTLDRMWRSIRDDDIQGIAAEVTFYAMFALFPFLLFVAALVGMLVPDPEAAMGRMLVLVHHLLPTTTATLIGDFLAGPLHSHRPDLLSIGALGVLWAGSQGLAAMLRALSRIYCARDTRNWIRRRALSLRMTIGAGFVCLVIILLMTGLDPDGVLGGLAQRWPRLFLLWTLLRWPALFLVLSAVLARLYTTVPCTRQRFRWITPGGLVATLIWLGASAVLPIYVDYSESYQRFYGSIGDVIVLMVWLYLVNFAVLLGAEINTAILRTRRRPASRRPQVDDPAARPAAHPAP